MPPVSGKHQVNFVARLWLGGDFFALCVSGVPLARSCVVNNESRHVSLRGIGLHPGRLSRSGPRMPTAQGATGAGRPS